MLLMKPSTAQGGSAFSFPHLGHYQSHLPALPYLAKVLHWFMSPVLKPL
jgi:hypothetical protein